MQDYIKKPFTKELLTISETAKLLHLSLDTLRRWDKSGKLKAIRRIAGGNRYYRREDIELFLEDTFALARTWGQSALPPDLPSAHYCEVAPRFQARLEAMSVLMAGRADLAECTPLVVAITGEIGNNSFDHNIGNWPDVPGVFFTYDLNKRVVVLADRGRGIRATLMRVRPGIRSDTEALEIAFTQFISGRAPERRGNGLKFVREVAEQYAIGFELQSGIAIARIPKGPGKLVFDISAHNARGTLTKIIF